ncbi:MAG: YraN family protein [Candidatus Marinimicrobia bacterium]|nr:YraN family protein [Candidatus Neomarinimicrobiota bacterium]
MKRKALGKKSERLAQKYLRKKQYKILATNFHSPVGEIDIIAQEGDVLVFVEVKSRRSEKFGSPEEAMTARKIERIIKTGEFFKLVHPEIPEAMRIDLVAINLTSTGRVKEIRIIKNITS